MAFVLRSKSQNSKNIKNKDDQIEEYRSNL